MKAACILALMSVLAICAAVGSAPNPPASAPAAGPKNEQGLTAMIVVNKASYVLNPAQLGAKFRSQLDEMKAGRGRARLPEPPAVDLTFRITNPTTKPVTIEISGDNSQVNLQLDGTGAVTMDNNVAMTMEFRIGTPVTIAPGKTYDMKVASLAFGLRGISKYAFWTEPGDYSLTASFTFGIGEKQGSVTSAAVELKVTTE
jgi:hypothetical protein